VKLLKHGDAVIRFLEIAWNRRSCHIGG
jgi:hypothetical protein